MIKHANNLKILKINMKYKNLVLDFMKIKLIKN